MRCRCAKKISLVNEVLVGLEWRDLIGQHLLAPFFHQTPAGHEASTANLARTVPGSSSSFLTIGNLSLGRNTFPTAATAKSRKATQQQNQKCNFCFIGMVGGVRFSVVESKEEGSKAIDWNEEGNRAKRGCADRNERKVRMYE